MQEIVEQKLLRLKGIVGIYPANSVGDDIEIYADKDRGQVQCRFFGLRQQAEKENESEPYMCISDFIAPKASEVPDYLGLFANGTFGVEEMVDKFKADVSTAAMIELSFMHCWLAFLSLANNLGWSAYRK